MSVRAITLEWAAMETSFYTYRCKKEPAAISDCCSLSLSLMPKTKPRHLGSNRSENKQQLKVEVV